MQIFRYSRTRARWRQSLTVIVVFYLLPGRKKGTWMMDWDEPTEDSIFLTSHHSTDIQPAS